MVLDRTKIDLTEVNVYRKLYWGKATLKILGPVAGGFKVLATLTKDWMCDEVHREKYSDVPSNPGQREVTFTVGDKSNTLRDVLFAAEMFEVNGRRYRVKVQNEPLDIRRIWKITGKYNSQDSTPIVP